MWRIKVARRLTRHRRFHNLQWPAKSGGAIPNLVLHTYVRNILEPDGVVTKTFREGTMRSLLLWLIGIPIPIIIIIWLLVGHA